MRRLLVQVLLGLFVFGGAWLVGRILKPLMGITGYVLTLIIFSFLGYYLNGKIGGMEGKPVRSSPALKAPVYSPPQQRIHSPPHQPMHAPPQIASETKTRYTPEQVRGMWQGIEERYSAGQIDRGRYEQQLVDLVFVDAYGRWWTIDARTGKWVQNKDGAWVEAEPPPWLQK